jgi:ribosomal-protein-alanine N-acetyltransferase
MSKINLIKLLNNKVPIDTGKKFFFINLRESRKYLNQFYKYSKNNSFFEFFEYKAFTNKKKFNYFFNNLIKVENNNYSNAFLQKFWLIIDDNQNLIGTAKINNIDINRNSLEWGYGINPKFWGKGFIIKMQFCLLKYIFETLKMNRLYGVTRSDNKKVIASIKLMNFRIEGKKFQYYKDYKGIYHDALSYSFLKKDYYQNLNKKNFNLLNNKNINFKRINSIISKVLKKKLDLNSNLEMSKIDKWDSLSHFDVIKAIEKYFKYNFTSEALPRLTSTTNIIREIK